MALGENDEFPKLSDQLVLWVDVLGTKWMGGQGERANDHLKVLFRANLEARSLLKPYNGSQFKVCSFTDNIVVCWPSLASGVSKADVLWYAACYLQVMLENGIMAKGALVQGPAYIDDNFVFGPALNAAYAIDQHDIKPRIVVDLSFYADMDPEERAVGLLKDVDGTMFVDHFHGMGTSKERSLAAKSQFDLVQSTLHDERTDSRARDKALWLLELYRFQCVRLGFPDDVPAGEGRFRFFDASGG